MKKYDVRDEMTCYFVYRNTGGANDEVFGWTDSKDMIDMFKSVYHNFNFRIMKRTDEWGNIVPLINENINDELVLYNLTTQGKNGKPEKVAVPLTLTLYARLQDMTTNFGLMDIDESIIEKLFPRIKKKYRDALNTLHFEEIMNANIHSDYSKFTTQLKMDEVKLLTSEILNASERSNWEYPRE